MRYCLIFVYATQRKNLETISRQCYNTYCICWYILFKKAADNPIRWRLPWPSWNRRCGNEIKMQPPGAEKDGKEWKTPERAKPCRPRHGEASVRCCACCCCCRLCFPWRLPQKPSLQRSSVSARFMRWYKKLHRLAQRNRTRCFYESTYEILLKIHHGGGKIIL